MKNIMGMMKQLQDMQENMQKMQAEAKEKISDGSAAGGLVTAQVSGDFKVKNIYITPSLLDDKNPEMIADLVQTAINNAVEKAQENMKDSASSMFGDMPLPGGLQNLFK